MTKCKTCGTKFIEDLCPTAVAYRRRLKARRARAAKKGWAKRRKRGLPKIRLDKFQEV